MTCDERSAGAPPRSRLRTAAAAVAQTASVPEACRRLTPALQSTPKPRSRRDIGWMNGTSVKKHPSSTRSFSRLKSAST